MNFGEILSLCPFSSNNYQKHSFYVGICLYLSKWVNKPFSLLVSHLISLVLFFLKPSKNQLLKNI